MLTRISSKGQIVLPKAVRERLGWTEGTELVVEVEGDRVVLRRNERRGWRRWRGRLEGADVLEVLEREHAEEVERW